MASGRLGKSDLPAAADTDLYTVPPATVATANITMCNRTAESISVRIAVRSGMLAASDYLEFDAELQPNGVLERTGIALSAGEIITCRAASAGVSARVHGFEEAA